MKKIALGLLIVAIIFGVIGCGFRETRTYNEQKVQEVKTVLGDENDQVHTAFYGNYEEKKDLIQSEELSSEGLVALCIYPYPMNLNSGIVQSWFYDAIILTDITPEDQVMIASFKDQLFSTALLLRDDLSSEGFVALCENSEVFDLKSKQVQKWFKSAYENIQFSEEELQEISNLNLDELELF